MIYVLIHTCPYTEWRCVLGVFKTEEGATKAASEHLSNYANDPNRTADDYSWSPFKLED